MHDESGTTFDVAVLGSGISGAVLALILASQGVKVVMIESGVHPRFAVGESTIPHTSMLSSMLAEQYGATNFLTRRPSTTVAVEALLNH